MNCKYHVKEPNWVIMNIQIKLLITRRVNSINIQNLSTFDIELSTCNSTCEGNFIIKNRQQHKHRN